MKKEVDESSYLVDYRNIPLTRATDRNKTDPD